MEELIERISDVVGPKWTSLLKELKMESNTRYKIEAKFPSGENKFKLWSKEALNLWKMKPYIANLTEEETIRKLLQIMRNIEPLKQIALETGFKMFTDQQTVPIPSTSTVVGGAAEAYVQESYSGRLHSTLPALPMVSTMSSAIPSMAQWQPHPVQVKQHKAYGGDYGLPMPVTRVGEEVTRGDAYSMASLVTDQHHTLAPCTQTNGFTTNAEGATAVTPTVIRDPCDEKIYIEDRYHKYALLDASQRMLRNTWEMLGPKLKVPVEVIQKLETKERNVHERYYKLFIEYVKTHRGNATFKELRRVLLECDEKLAVTILEERLRTRKEVLVSAIEYDFLSEKKL